MRVAFYAPMKPPTAPGLSGDRRFAALLMQAIRQGGHDPELISRFCSRDGAGDAARQARLAAIGARLAARLTRRLRQRPACEQPAAWLTYHLYHKAPDWLGPTVTQALDIPYFVAEASSAAKQAEGPWRQGYAAANAAIAAAAAVFVPNPADRPGLRCIVDNEDRLVDLAPFLDPTPFDQAYQQRGRHRDAIRRRLGLPPEQPILLAVGMMRAGDKEASYEVLAQTLRLLTADDWTLLVAGDGPRRTAIVDRLAAAGGDARVVTLGAVAPDALPPLYAAADIFVWPAVREAIGMALLEAQATGLPVVAGRAGAIPAIVRHNQTGVLTPVRDRVALAGAVRQLLREPARRQRMSAAALVGVRSNHTLRAAAATLDTALNKSRNIRSE